MVVSAELPVTSIYWNSSNPLFARNSASRKFTVYMPEKFDLVCPYYERGTVHEQMEVSLLYLVDRVGYESCSINGNAQLAGMCTAPYKKQIITVVFRRFTPNPGGLEFHPGRRYYLVSTSDGPLKGLQNRNGGLCLARNMRLEFDVKEKLPISQNETTRLLNGVAFLSSHLLLKNVSKMQANLNNSRTELPVGKITSLMANEISPVTMAPADTRGKSNFNRLPQRGSGTPSHQLCGYICSFLIVLLSVIYLLSV
uniref:Ephrin RBD domain-containing protein n=1 Tax=Trichuris muris TaxID=70415 RepID=A0A5S6R0P9_TRIMR